MFKASFKKLFFITSYIFHMQINAYLRIARTEVVLYAN